MALSSGTGRLIFNASGQVDPTKPGHLHVAISAVGVFGTEDGGYQWTPLNRETRAVFPSEFGFPLALHPREPGTLFVIPLQGAEFRCPPGGQLRVHRSRDGGQSWTALGEGLPSADSFGVVLREGMAADTLSPCGVYFGTNGGKQYGSIDEGEWRLLADDLPPVYSVTAFAPG